MFWQAVIQMAENVSVTVKPKTDKESLGNGRSAERDSQSPGPLTWARAKKTSKQGAWTLCPDSLAQLGDAMPMRSSAGVRKCNADDKGWLKSD